MAGYVYIMHAQGTDRYKIGMTQYPAARITSANTDCPYPLTYLVTALVPDPRVVESELHRKFDHARIPGKEWFTLSPDEVTTATGILNYYNHLYGPRTSALEALTKQATKPLIPPSARKELKRIYAEYAKPHHLTPQELHEAGVPTLT
jgi:hypothetical protein